MSLLTAHKGASLMADADDESAWLQDIVLDLSLLTAASLWCDLVGFRRQDRLQALSGPVLALSEVLRLPDCVARILQSLGHRSYTAAVPRLYCGQ